MDFTVNIYHKLLDQLLKAGYTFQTFSEFIEKPKDLVILLRHDVDAKKMNSLRFAQIQNRLGIKGTYYFRMVPQSYDEEIVKEVASLGHEVGYHYEDMDLVSSKFGVRSSKLKEEDLFETAIASFQANLEKFRKIYPVKTICMHGSPLSKFDNKSLWRKYNYKDFGIIGEPYFDIDFSEVLYLTDTGRRWDGDKVSIRDKVELRGQKVKSQKVETINSGINRLNELSFNSTRDIIKSIEEGSFPKKVMFTFHPQRWNDDLIPWIQELILQNIKNQVKRYYIKRGS